MQLARITERAALARTQADLLAMLPERERGRAAARALRDGLPPCDAVDLTRFDWSRELGLAAQHPAGLAGIWDAEIAPVLGLPQRPTRYWRPPQGQRDRCFQKLVALRNQAAVWERPPLAPSGVLQHLRSLDIASGCARTVRPLRPPDDTVRVVRSIMAHLQRDPDGLAPRAAVHPPRPGPVAPPEAFEA
jgi:hypothetical protein